MRLIGLTTDGGNGWLPWVTDDAAFDQMIGYLSRIMEREEYAGLFIAAGCGKIQPRHCGYNRDGDKLVTWWAGHDDGPMVENLFELACRWPIVTQIGFPTTTLHGLDALLDDCKRLADLNHDMVQHTVAFDVSGSNTSAMVGCCMDIVEHCGLVARYESRPLTDPLYLHARYVCMAARARAIQQNGGNLDPDDIIVYTGSKGTRNYWLDPEARVYESRGHVVVQPMQTIGGE